MFGANKPQGGAFGGGSTTTGTPFQFGSANNNTTAGTNGGFSFGGNNNNNNATASVGNFGFGNNSNNNAANNVNSGNTGFKFGGTANSNSNQTTNFGFGTGNSNNAGSSASGLGVGMNKSLAPSIGRSFSLGNAGGANNATTTGGGFSFGNKPAAPVTGTSGTTGSLFGAKPATTGFSLGASNNTTSLFGSKPISGGLFGQNQLQNQQQQQQQQQLQQQVPQNTSFTTTSSQPTFSWSNTQTNQQFSQQPQQQLQTQTTQLQPRPGSTTNGYTPTISDQLDKIKNSWDANSPQCIMKTHFYNKAPQEFNNYQRPLEESPEEWERAMKERPKNYNSIPIKVKGFEDLLKRSNLQIEYIKQSRVILNQINDNLVKLGDKHDLDSTSILLKCKLKQKQLDIKLLKIAINLSILKYKGYPLTNDEERLVMKFKELLDQIDDPIGLNRANELWARLSNLKQRLGNLDVGERKVERQEGKDEKSVTGKNETVIAKLAKVLSKEQQGIQYLYEMIEGDKEALEKFER
ncbi:DEKNAAC102200 [Brettanomyces naardenensis]|uniref:DEKNAAC102200 n=1 Tax=Brettanomyces naardenensis TaxID=13370 RepID=A0A448YK46_BRENA|nr:DEKNAAC102200 [Brettanomyces naardenensis]